MSSRAQAAAELDEYADALSDEELDAGERATPSWREYVKPGSNEREDPSTLHGKVTGSNRGGIGWSHLRAALVQALSQTVRDAKKRDRDRVMNELCAGEEGRAWLHRGKFASALPYERSGQLDYRVLILPGSRHR